MKLFGQIYLQDSKGRSHVEVLKALDKLVEDTMFIEAIARAGFEEPEVDPFIMDIDDPENYREVTRNERNS